VVQTPEQVAAAAAMASLTAPSTLGSPQIFLVQMSTVPAVTFTPAAAAAAIGSLG
jgi:hypothetical protein